jgi:para-nitrobenzyl esterase
MPQSGAAVAVLAPETADRVSHRLLRHLMAQPEDLARMPFETLLPAQRDICDQSYNFHDFARDGSVTMLGVPFQPVIDGTSLPEHPERAAAEGRTAPVPMVIGCTTGEYVTHATAQPEMDFALAARLLDPRVRPVGLTGDEIVRRYRELLPHHSPRGIWRAVGGDLVFQNPTSRFAALHARFQPVHKYLYGAIEPDELGAAHGAEVGAVWYRDGLDASRIPARQQVADPAFARAVHEVWVWAVSEEPPRLPGGPDWPALGTAAPIVARLAGGRLFTERDPFADRLALWDPEYGRSGLTAA